MAAQLYETTIFDSDSDLCATFIIVRSGATLADCPISGGHLFAIVAVQAINVMVEDPAGSENWFAANPALFGWNHFQNNFIQVGANEFWYLDATATERNIYANSQPDDEKDYNKLPDSDKFDFTNEAPGEDRVRGSPGYVWYDKPCAPARKEASRYNDAPGPLTKADADEMWRRLKDYYEERVNVRFELYTFFFCASGVDAGMYFGGFHWETEMDADTPYESHINMIDPPDDIGMPEWFTGLMDPTYGPIGYENPPDAGSGEPTEGGDCTCPK